MAEYVFSINNRKDVLIDARMKEKHTDESDEFIHTVPKCGETVCSENHDRFYYVQSGEMKTIKQDKCLIIINPIIFLKISKCWQ